MPEEHRTKIANSKILNRLIDHVEGKCELSASQVTAGLGLLRKVMPDMTESKSDVNVEIRSVMRIPEPKQDTTEWLKTSSGSPNPAPKPH